MANKFICNTCKNYFTLEELTYDPYTRTRYCGKCWPEFKKIKYNRWDKFSKEKLGIYPTFSTVGLETKR